MQWVRTFAKSRCWLSVVIMGLVKFPCHLVEVSFDKTSPSWFPSPMLLVTTLLTNSWGIPNSNSPEPAPRTMLLRVRQFPTSDGLQIVVDILGRCRSAELSQCARGNVRERFYDPWWLILTLYRSNRRRRRHSHHLACVRRVSR